MTKLQKQTWRGLAVFVAATFGLSWGAAALVDLLWGAEPLTAPGFTRLFTLSLTYAAAMGWQPLVAIWVVRRWVDPPATLDHGLIPARRKHIVAAAIAAVLVVAAAAGLAWALGLADDTLQAVSPESRVASESPDFWTFAGLAVALVGTVTMIWVQAFAEEIGWRGYFLSRLMRNIGPWRGLCLHGMIWGVWYAPIMLFAGSDWQATLPETGAFVFTCVLLGVLLGWIRLASSSVVPATVANVTMTLGVGLPYMINGIDAGVRGSLFGPVGWALMLIIAATIAASRWRRFVRVPVAPGREVAFRFLLVVDRRWWVDRARNSFELN